MSSGLLVLLRAVIRDHNITATPVAMYGPTHPDSFLNVAKGPKNATRGDMYQTPRYKVLSVISCCFTGGGTVPLQNPSMSWDAAPSDGPGTCAELPVDVVRLGVVRKVRARGI